jgi:hypothetical protein
MFLTILYIDKYFRQKGYYFSIRGDNISIRFSISRKNFFSRFTTFEHKINTNQNDSCQKVSKSVNLNQLKSFDVILYHQKLGTICRLL